MWETGFDPLSRQIKKSFKKVMTAPIMTAKQQMWLSLVPGDVLINRCSVSQSVWYAKQNHCPMARISNYRFTICNGSVCTWVMRDGWQPPPPPKYINVIFKLRVLIMKTFPVFKYPQLRRIRLKVLTTFFFNKRGGGGVCSMC